MGVDIDSFIRNANENIYPYSDKKMELVEVAEKGKCPCSECEFYDEHLSCRYASKCVAWYKWFQLKWRNIQKAAQIIKAKEKK